MQSACSVVSEWFISIAWLEVLKAFTTLVVGLSWPIVILLVAMIFREQIVGLLPRVREAGPGGIKLAPPDQLEVTTTSDTPTPQNALPPASMYVASVEMHFRQVLANSHADLREPMLFRELAIQRTTAHFERIYRVLFGSQLFLLKQTNVQGMVTKADARLFFGRSGLPEMTLPEPITFESWLQFLVQNELLADRGHMVEILPGGREFLAYMVTASMAEYRPF